jgi:hypothetical protein
VKQIVGSNFEVTGIVKPGARTEEIVNTVSRDIGKLTNKDMAVVWTGALDVAKNETEKGLQQIKTLVEYRSQTNIIVMSVLHRHDLEYKSCVNDEVEWSNRKLRKIMKVFKNARVIEVESERDCFTKHGLHMNSKGKEQTAKKKIAKEILDILKGKKSDPIIMKGKDEQGIKEEGILTQMTKELQGSAKEKNTHKEEMGREKVKKRVNYVGKMRDVKI